ncbi:response regulator transcription factor [Streptomyces sp. NPDC020742]|uniref:response regulator transcription factor n=1 Tax=Streptomyces sp. NPDC020742 TaxID=3154897 RepID=UPI0033D0E176
MNLRIVVADDQEVIREGLMTLLDLMPGIDVVGGAVDGEQALEQVAALRPDAILMDLNMPGTDGIAATVRITQHHPHTAVVVLTTYAEEPLILDALRAGARGYLTKDAGKAEIVRAIEAAVTGHTTLAPAVHQQLLDAAVRTAPAAAPRPGRSADTVGLTTREQDVLRLMAQGLSNAAIGRRLVIGEATVKTHVNHLFAKLGTRTRAEAVAWAHGHGYAPPPQPSA